jgi:hypothetical protein
MNDLDSTMLVIGDTPQLFLDNLIIEACQDMTKTFHQPTKDPANPVIKQDKPWENSLFFQSANHVVCRDSQNGLFKCWYEDVIDGSPEYSLFDGRQCYAESTDGIHWEKPELDIVVENGRKTNIVLGAGADGIESAHSLGVIEDPFPADDGQRFRALFSHYPPYEGEIRMASSADGIRWTVADERPCFGKGGSKMGDASMLHYDHWNRTFVAYCRHWYLGHASLNPRNPVGPTNPGPRYPYDFSRQNRRRIFLSESPDMQHWGQPYAILCPDDEDDNLDDGFYGMKYDQAGNLHIGFLNVFHRVRNEIDVQLVFSHDRKRWRHANNHQPWLPQGAPGEWDQHMVNVSSQIVEVGDELLIFYGGANCHHDYHIWGKREGLDHPETRDPSLVRYGLGLARLRKEGFASVGSGAVREGLLVTRPFMSDGTGLVINARCGTDGYIVVEVVDDYDEPLKDRRREDCDVFTGDSTAHRMSWKGDPMLPVARPEFGGSTVFPWKKQEPYRKLRFFMKNAEIFSFCLKSS